MLTENKKMQEFLRVNGIDAIPKYIKTGSLKRSWRLYGKTGTKTGDIMQDYQRWTPELCEKLTDLGFTGFHGALGKFSGNGGLFSVFVRGHFEFLKGGDTK